MFWILLNQKIFLKKNWKISRKEKNFSHEKSLKRTRMIVFESWKSLKQNILKKLKKTLKKVEKICKKVLTKEKGYDILHERSTEGRKKQRSLKIEQQQIRTN